MRYCIALEWASPLDMAPCAVGEPADYTGLRINAIYDDGSRDTVDVTFKMFNESNLQVAGPERKSMITYSGQKLAVAVPLIDAYLDHIEVETKSGFVCREGEELDRANVCVVAYYSDGSSREVSNYKVFPFTRLTTDMADVSIRYGRCKAVLDISVLPREDSKQTDSVPVPSAAQAAAPSRAPEPTPHTAPDEVCPQPALPPVFEPSQATTKQNAPNKTIQCISVSRSPNKQKYLVGDCEVDLSGGKIDLIYSDGTAGQIDMFADGTVELESRKAGRGSVSFQCFGKPVSFAVEVLEPKVTRIEIKKMPARCKYIDGEHLDLTGLVLEALYIDSSKRTVRGLQSHDYIVTMADADDGVTLNYEGASFTIPVEVEKERVPPTVLEILLGGEPEKASYIERETGVPDLTGALLLVQMSDGRREPIPVTSDMVTTFDISKPGRTLMKIEYSGFAVTCFIQVKPRTLQELQISSGPNKCEYMEGEIYALKGVVIYALYDNGEREAVSDYEVDKTYASLGDEALVFSYQGLSSVCPVKVNPVQVLSLEWSRTPTKSIYYTGEKAFSCDGGVLKVKKNDETTDTVLLMPEMISGFHTKRTGPLTIKASYGGVIIPLTVSVQERNLLGINVRTQPRVEYHEGEPFNPRGMVVEALYSGETREVVEASYTPQGPLPAYVTQVMIVYKDKAAVLPITVAPSMEAPIEQGKSEPTPEPGDETAPEVALESPLEQQRASGETSNQAEPFEPTDIAAAVEPQVAEPPASHPAATGSKAACAELQEQPAIKHKPVPDFYPSTFCIRFETDPDDTAF